MFSDGHVYSITSHVSRYASDSNSFFPQIKFAKSNHEVKNRLKQAIQIEYRQIN